jgi:hypothetical protein
MCDRRDRPTKSIQAKPRKTKEIGPWIFLVFRNCPALSSGLCESEAGDQLDGGGHQGLDEVPALFSGG